MMINELTKLIEKLENRVDEVEETLDWYSTVELDNLRAALASLYEAKESLEMV